MKQCTKCKEWKEENEFYKDKRVKGGLRSWCKLCSIAGNKQYFAKKYREDPKFRERYNAANAEYQRNRRRLKNTPERKRSPINGELSKTNGVCTILKNHVYLLKDDPERLTTDFIKKVSGIRRSACTEVGV